MQSLIIVPPARAAVVSTSTTALARLITPDPKEGAALTSNASLVVDLGVVTAIDTAFLGYHTGTTAGQTWTVSSCNPAGVAIEALAPTASVAPLGLGPPSHSLARRGSPLSSRYWRLDLAVPTPFSVGVFALGKAWRSTWGQEMGGGRGIEDTGTAERLFGGGFAIDDGAAASTYQWTFGDLQADEIRTLYQIAKDRRTTRTVLVVEDDEQTDGLNERMHWGLFGNFETYERLDPANWRWSLQVKDWA